MADRLLMGKRKASVFTVAESVTNWFEASRAHSTTSEPTQEGSDQRAAGIEVVDPSISSQPATIRGGISQPNRIQPLLTVGPQRASAAHIQPGSPSDVAVPPGIDDASSRDRPHTG